jgi:hypothetical protein
VNPNAERVAQNQAAFREANEGIDSAAQGVVDRAPFLCECADSSCTALIRLDLDEYRRVREDSRRFAMTPGHETNAEGWARVIDRNDRFVVAEKIGEAGEVAEELDRRLIGEDA